MLNRILHSHLLTLLVLFGLSSFAPHSASATGTTPQTISLQPIADQTLGIAPFQVLAVTPSNLPLVFTVTGPATLYRRVLTITGLGTVSLHVHQAGNNTYSEADAQESFEVNPGVSTIAWTPPNLVYGQTLATAMQNATASAHPFNPPSADVVTFSGPFNASQITGTSEQGLADVTITPASPIFRYEGEFIAPSTQPNDKGGYTPTAENPANVALLIAFTCDCDQFEFKVQSRESWVQLWVDGDYTTPDQISQINKYPDEYYYRAQFPDRRTRQIKVRLNGAPPFFGIILPPGEMASAPQYPVGDRVIIYGDSWTGPTISPNAFPPLQTGLGGNGYPQWLGSYFNWDYISSPDGGEGYVNPGTTHSDFAQRILDENICGLNPKAMVIVGGVNDSSNYSGVFAGAKQVLSELSACLPNGPVIIVGPQNPLPESAQALHDAAALYPGMAHYEDMEADNWFYGAEYDQTEGNNWDYTGVSTDGGQAHPSPDGHDFLAARIAWFMQTELPSYKEPIFFTEASAALPGTFSYSVNDGTLLPAGTDPVSVTFTPTDNIDYALATQDFNVTVGKATSTTTLTSPSGATNGSAVSLSATVTPQFGGVPTGTITLLLNGQSLGSFPLSSGQAAITGITLGGGSQVLTASYSGDGNFLPSQSAGSSIAVSTVDFSLGSTLSAATLTATAPVSVPLTITPIGPFNASLALTCTALPAGASCALSGSTTSTVAINAQPANISVVISEGVQTAMAESLSSRLSLALGMLPMFFLFGKRRINGLLLAIITSGSLLILSGCGATETKTVPKTQTASTQYIVAITLTDAMDPKITHSQQVTVTVQ